MVRMVFLCTLLGTTNRFYSRIWRSNPNEPTISPIRSNRTVNYHNSMGILRKYNMDNFSRIIKWNYLIFIKMEKSYLIF